jgi:hypothetical protein
MDHEQTEADLGLSDVFAEALESIRSRNAWRAEHRQDCTKRPCMLCELWVCARCKGDSENPPDDRDESRRPALCATCTRRWDRDLALAPALESIGEWYRQAVPGEAGTRFMTANVPSYPELRRALYGVVKGPGSCVLSGPSRAGKTLTASYMLRLIVEAGRDLAATREELARAAGARCISALELAESKRQHPLGRGEAPLVTEAIRATVLLLDDCGQEDDAGRQVVRQVFMARDRRATWPTTFLEKEEFGRRYGGGALSRLVEAGTWFDLRGAG